MPDTPTLKELVAINLQYDAGNAALNVRAVSQLILKQLFAGGHLKSEQPKEIQKAVAKVLGIRTLSIEHVLAGLEFLNGKRLARESSGRWLLTDDGFAAVERDLQRAESRLIGILHRHFPQRLDPEVLRKWFNDACVAFYEIYGAQWAAAIGRLASPVALTRSAVLGLLASTSRRHGLEIESDVLTEGFHAFLASQDTDDLEHNWSLGQALLAAKIVAVNVGADPVTAREFRDSLLLLDTNVLLVAELEGHALAQGLEELAELLKSLNVELAYTEDTRDEYRRVVTHRREKVHAAVANYTLGVLRDSDDAFIATALARGCITPAEFDAFFDQILDPPSQLGTGVPIQVRSDAAILAMAASGKADARLCQEIVDTWNSQRSFKKKKPPAAYHDAALTAIAEGMTAAGSKCSVLTLDMTMHDLARRRAGRSARPLWIPLSALIQVMALDNAGPGFDASEFSPLLARLIQRQAEPLLGTYEAEDLALMLDVDQRCALLSEATAKDIAGKVAGERLRGMDKRDPELLLTIRRAFQAGLARDATDKDQLQRQLTVRDADLRSRDGELVRERQRSGAVWDLAVASRTKELRRSIDLHTALDACASVALTAALAYATWRGGSHYFPKREGEFVALVATLFALYLAIPTRLCFRVIPQWRNARKGAGAQARRELDEALSRAEV